MEKAKIDGEARLGFGLKRSKMGERGRDGKRKVGMKVGRLMVSMYHYPLSFRR